MTCGGDLQKIFKDSLSLKGLSKIAQKKHQNLSVFAFFAFLTSKMTSKFKFNLIRPT